MALIFILSSFSHLPGPPAGLSDKHVHAFTFGLLAALWMRARSGARLRATSGRAAIEGFTVAAFWGAIDEWHQSFVPGRSADPADLAADAAGALIAAAVLMACAIIARSARTSAGRRPAR
jgi:VanZ family protein